MKLKKERERNTKNSRPPDMNHEEQDKTTQDLVQKKRHLKKRESKGKSKTNVNTESPEPAPEMISHNENPIEE